MEGWKACDGACQGGRNIRQRIFSAGHCGRPVSDADTADDREFDGNQGFFPDVSAEPLCMDTAGAGWQPGYRGDGAKQPSEQCYDGRKLAGEIIYQYRYDQAGRISDRRLKQCAESFS